MEAIDQAQGRTEGPLHGCPERPKGQPGALSSGTAARPAIARLLPWSWRLDLGSFLRIPGGRLE